MADALLVEFVDLIDPVLSAAKAHSPAALMIAIDVLRVRRAPVTEAVPAVQDRQAFHSACPALRPPTGRELLAESGLTRRRFRQTLERIEQEADRST